MTEHERLQPTLRDVIGSHIVPDDEPSTPTTTAMRDWYVEVGHVGDAPDRAKEFDRWLAAHDAALRERIAREIEAQEHTREEAQALVQAGYSRTATTRPSWTQPSSHAKGPINDRVQWLPSECLDGLPHSYRFDGDDPYIECVYCGEYRDALSGRVIRKGRTS